MPLARWKMDQNRVFTLAQQWSNHGNWKLPDPGAVGTIQNRDKGVNGYLSVNNDTAPGTGVVEEALDITDVGQLWERSVSDEWDYFSLKNLNSGKFLQGISTYVNNTYTYQLTIQGTYSKIFL